ncbi:MAG: DNA polymerase III subunit gamma/tau, partial [Alphaproteobacteria bacterium]|nr:DNA polymerase III subunit gamma/tau [Alphaproteobacteria bacterium]
LALLARAADGSVRDGLSLLDQTIAQSDPGAAIGVDQVRDMLGLADRGVVFDLADALIAGDAAEAIAVAERMHAVGADPAVVLNDLLELAHWLTRLKIDPTAGGDALMPEAERARGAQMAEPLSVPVLARLWQALLKGVGELNQAPSPLLALEMLLVRVAYMANLPSPADLVRQLQEGGAAAAPRPPAAPSDAPPSRPRAVGAMPVGEMPVGEMPVGHMPVGDMPVRNRPVRGAAAVAPAAAAVSRDRAPPPPIEDIVDLPPAGPEEEEAAVVHPLPESFAALVGYLEKRKIEPLLTARLRSQVRPVAFAPGMVTVALVPGADREIVQSLRLLLERLYGNGWRVTLAESSDAATVAEQAEAAEAAEREAVLQHPLVQATLDAFPGASVGAIRSRAIEVDPDEAVMPPEDED